MPLDDNLPVGTILIWPGNPGDLPQNWKECNGRSYLKSKYADLYDALGDRWIIDEGLNKDMFSIPDLRGVFLRGVNNKRNDSFRDPDVESRTRINSKATISPDDAGSYQHCEIQRHSHPFSVGGNFPDPKNALLVNCRTEYHDQTEAGGNETRPINAYVYYIIKIAKSAQ